MQHLLVEVVTNSDVATNYPHTPTDIPLSYQDYLEGKLSSGYELVSHAAKATNEYLFVFKVVAK